MSGSVTVIIDGQAVAAPATASVMDACDGVGVYVPRLCAYPGLPPLGDCGLCFVNIDGVARRACSVNVAEGMTIVTADEEAQGFRRNSMAAILGDHPHVCLICPLRDGCSRDQCVYGNPPEDRCCDQFGRCEFAEVAAFVGALADAPPHSHRSLPTTTEQTIERRLDLCVGCGRCVAACDVLEEAGSALKLVETASLAPLVDAPEEWKPQSYLGRHVAVPKAQTLRASGCTFCAACVMVCPSGALSAAGERGARWLAKRRGRTTLAPVVFPPQDRYPLTTEVVGSVPAAPGVFRILDADGNVLQIGGVPDLRAGLERALALGSAPGAAFFIYAEDDLYTQGESELLARYLQEHGRMPPGNELPDELFLDDQDMA